MVRRAKVVLGFADVPCLPALETTHAATQIEAQSEGQSQDRQHDTRQEDTTSSTSGVKPGVWGPEHPCGPIPRSSEHRRVGEAKDSTTTGPRGKQQCGVSPRSARPGRIEERCSNCADKLTEIDKIRKKLAKAGGDIVEIERPKIHAIALYNTLRRVVDVIVVDEDLRMVLKTLDEVTGRRDYPVSDITSEELARFQRNIMDVVPDLVRHAKANAEAIRNMNDENARTAADVKRLRMDNRQHMFLLEDEQALHAEATKKAEDLEKKLAEMQAEIAENSLGQALKEARAEKAKLEGEKQALEARLKQQKEEACASRDDHRKKLVQAKAEGLCHKDQLEKIKADVEERTKTAAICQEQIVGLEADLLKLKQESNQEAVTGLQAQLGEARAREANLQWQLSQTEQTRATLQGELDRQTNCTAVGDTALLQSFAELEHQKDKVADLERVRETLKEKLKVARAGPNDVELNRARAMIYELQSQIENLNTRLQVAFSTTANDRVNQLMERVRGLLDEKQKWDHERIILRGQFSAAKQDIQTARMQAAASGTATQMAVNQSLASRNTSLKKNGGR